jgi:hypothetical protein
MDALILAVLIGIPAALVTVLARSARGGSLRSYRLAVSTAFALALVGGFLTVLSASAHDPGSARTEWVGGLGVAGSLAAQFLALVLAAVGLVRSLRSESGTEGWRLIATGVTVGTLAVVGLVVLAAWDTAG